jgi:hypothetical protein
MDEQLENLTLQDILDKDIRYIDKGLSKQGQLHSVLTTIFEDNEPILTSILHIEFDFDEIQFEKGTNLKFKLLNKYEHINDISKTERSFWVVLYKEEIFAIVDYNILKKGNGNDHNVFILNRKILKTAFKKIVNKSIDIKKAFNIGDVLESKTSESFFIK